VIEHARHLWAQTVKAGDGASVSDHEKALAKRGKGKAQAQPLEPPPLPDEAQGLWAAFCALHQTRGGGFGPGPISFHEIDAYQRLTGAHLDPWEVQAIRAVDMAYMQHEAAQAKARSQEGRAH